MKLICQHLSAVFCLGLFIYSCDTSPSQNPPNIIHVIVDDLGTNDLGCYGSENIMTPNLDRLAREGLLFTQAYSGCTVCAPARSTLMTGQHMGHTPVRGNTGGISLPESTYTMADLFKEAGYVTGGFGKWGIAEIGTPGVPEQQGFDQFFGYYHQIHAHDYFPDYLYENSRRIDMPGIRNDSASYTAYRIFEETKNFIEANQDRPFFCYAAWTLPHGRYEIPDTDPAVDLYADKSWAENYKNYAAMVSLLDRQLGKLFYLLESLGLSENTLLVFTSDNGGGIEFDQYKTNGNLRGFKRDLYEGGIRIPMVAHWPGKIPGGAQTDLPVYFPDFMPSFAEAIGAQHLLPDDLDGKSFMPWILEPRKKHRTRILYWEYPHYDWRNKTYPDEHFKQALREGKWKLVRTGQDKSWELYNLKSDPYEQHNLASTRPELINKYQSWINANRVDALPQIEPERQNGKAFR